MLDLLSPPEPVKVRGLTVPIPPVKVYEDPPPLGISHGELFEGDAIPALCVNTLEAVREVPVRDDVLYIDVGDCWVKV